MGVAACFACGPGYHSNLSARCIKYFSVDSGARRKDFPFYPERRNTNTRRKEIVSRQENTRRKKIEARSQDNT